MGEIGDYHDSILGPNIDHAVVYAKDCAGDETHEQCAKCAISFTATVDAWDFMQDLNLTSTSFCGLEASHGGFVDEMRGFMRNDTWHNAMDFLRTRCTTQTYAVDTYMTDIIEETTNFLIGMVGGQLDTSALYPLLNTVLWLSPNMNDPNPELAFEFDATPALLEDLGFRHANVQYREIAHPKGTEAVSSNWATVSCADPEKTAAPRSELLHVFWATLGSLAMKKVREVLAGPDVTTPFPPNRDYSAGFPNHHLCCYLLGLTGGTGADCGTNPDTGVAYVCDAPAWR